MSITNRESATCQMKLATWNTTTSNSPAAVAGSSLLVSSSTSDYYEETNTPNARQCQPNFDRSLCWFNVSLGDVGQLSCPFTFCSSVPGCERIREVYMARRKCYENGTWGNSVK
jgi:hypothetical protein